jgi:hypothetical protein
MGSCIHIHTLKYIWRKTERQTDRDRELQKSVEETWAIDQVLISACWEKIILNLEKDLPKILGRILVCVPTCQIRKFLLYNKRTASPKDSWIDSKDIYI